MMCYFSTYKGQPINSSDCGNSTLLADSDPCWNSSHLTRMGMYRICVVSTGSMCG
ncbi:hypothetical protein DPMN_033075 [Dreissena polymorpha]|uniref:Uncharacterized protein n=1 Tax=Dreissena polymorpha TaxID=45954 RepID=A0A9D4M5E2_DREPO|nr:hypothetical protein DPMN_033075 [Dreissena polymorpha]